MKSLAPVINLWWPHIRYAWQNFKLRTINPLAPHLPQLVVKRATRKGLWL